MELPLVPAVYVFCTNIVSCRYLSVLTNRNFIASNALICLAKGIVAFGNSSLFLNPK